MKRIIAFLTFSLALAIMQPALAQSAANVQDAAITAASDSAGIEAYSDTTSAVDTDYDSVQQTHYSYQVAWDKELSDDPFEILDKLFSYMTGGMVIFLIVVALIFFIAPLAVIALIIYLICRKSKRVDKSTYQQNSESANQPINPSTPLPTNASTRLQNEEKWADGIKKLFLGLGIIVCCWIIDFDFGSAAGWILFFYGLGLIVIAKSKKNQ